MFDLIELIYETAVFPQNWPKLLIALEAELEKQTAIVDHEVGTIAEHFQRAVFIASRLAEQEDQSQLLDTALDQMPLATLLVDSNARIISMNGKARELERRQRLLEFSDGRMVATQPGPQRKLGDLLCRAEGNGAKPLSIRGDDQHLSIMAIELDLAPCVHYGEVKLVLIADSGKTSSHVSEQYLQSHYDLTKAEARLASDFVAGGDLRSLAADYQVSYNTVRTQMKRTMAKVGVNRQSELVQKILSGPFSLLPEPEEIKSLGGCHSMRLIDGRSLSWAEYGPKGGMPVVLCHSSIWSRLQRHPDDSILAEHNIRLIVPDRPGYGRSDPLERRRITDWPQDLAQLLDHLKLDAVSVMGIMLGADYALTTAEKLPERVKSVALLSARLSPSLFRAYRSPSQVIRLLEKITASSPGFLSTITRLVFRDILRNPDPYVEIVLGRMGNKDREMWENSDMKEIFLRSFRESNRQGIGKAFVEDWVLLSQPCAYEPENITVPVHIWHGRHEALSRAEYVEMFAQTLPDARLNIVEGENKFIFFHHWRDVMQALASD